MPIKGRPRLVSSKASGTKLFVDDLREVLKLAQTEGGKTVSDVLRELVHEALVIRRLQATALDQKEDLLRHLNKQAIPNGIHLLEGELRDIKEMIGNFAANGQHSSGSASGNRSEIHTLLTEILGFSMAAEMKAHLLLQNFLMSRGVSEEAAKRLIAEHEEKSRRHTQKIVTGLNQIQR